MPWAQWSHAVSGGRGRVLTSEPGHYIEQVFSRTGNNRLSENFRRGWPDVTAVFG